MTGKALLITGGTGLLGLHWAAACRDYRQVTIAVHRRTPSLHGATLSAIDLSDPRAVEDFLIKGGIGCVIHAAGLTSVERCEQDPDAAHHCNVTLASTVATAASRAGAALIHISTDHLFDGNADMYDEDSAVSPVNAYGRTKALAEEEVLREHPNALVLRTNFYGWGPLYRPSFSDWLLASLHQRHPLKLFADMRYTPTNITPLVEAAMLLSEKGVSGIIHAVGDEALSKYTFGLRLAEHFGFSPARIEPVRLADQVDLVRRPLSMALSTRRLQQVLGHGLGSTAEHLDLLRAQKNNPAITEIRRL